MALAIFDLDHTLIKGDSNQAWAELLCELGVVDIDNHQSESRRFYKEYVAGTLDIDEFLKFALTPLKENNMQQLLKWRERFMIEKINLLMLEKAHACIAEHQKRGDFTLIITASNDFIAAPIAKAFKVDDMLSTTTEIIDDQFTGNYIDGACFHAGKITKLMHWLESNKHSLQGSYFYSDSYNDLPLLEKVSYPIAVDADEKLSIVAEQKNWKQVSFL